MAPTNEATGSCLCGAVRYKVSGALRPVIYCHCGQCHKTSGNFVAASACDSDSLVLIEDGGLRWYDSSSYAERGFCSVCGGNLFWRSKSAGRTSIMAGTFDAPTGLKAIAHIFADNVSDFQEIADGLPQFADDGPDDLGET